MDKQHEEIIVKSFFNKRLQDRVIFELTSAKKRKDAIGRLSHNYMDLLNNKYMIEIPKPNSDYVEIIELLKRYGAKEVCYVISYDENLDGKALLLLEAMKNSVGNGMPSIISCIPGELAYFEAEQVMGAPPRFILRRENI
jgi:hypothetical protein